MLKYTAMASFASGVTKLVYDLGCAYFSAKKPIDHPVFHEKLQMTILDIVSLTYTQHETGGYFQNVLLYGPPGTGKTMLSKWIAENSNMDYVMFSGTDLLQFVQTNTHASQLNRIFDDARRSYNPTIIFIDEADIICSERTPDAKTENIEMVNAFLAQTGEPSDKFMVILATNKYSALDPSVISRLDFKLAINLPEAAERAAILESKLSDLFRKDEISSLFTKDFLEEIAQLTNGFSGRTLVKMLNHLSGLRAGLGGRPLTQGILRAGIDRFIEREKEAAVLLNH